MCEYEHDKSVSVGSVCECGDAVTVFIHLLDTRLDRFAVFEVSATRQVRVSENQECENCSAQNCKTK